MNNAFDLDGTGLGWFSLFVAVAAVVYSWWNFGGYGALSTDDAAVGDLFGVLWASWAVLWFFFFLVLGLGKTQFTQFTGSWTAAQGIYTGLVPALVLLNVPDALTTTFAVVIGAVSIVTFIAFFALFRPRWSPAPEGPTAYGRGGVSPQH
jgi:hypothetical protein